MANEKINTAAQAIKSAILEAQYQAGKAANAQMLSLYYGVGQYVSANSRKGFWGTGAIKGISEQLQKELPGLRGFSARSIKDMRQFFEEWSPAFKSAAVAADLRMLPDKSTATATEIKQLPAKSSTVVDDLPESVNTKLLYKPQISSPEIDFAEFLAVSFTHHMEILHKAKTLSDSASIIMYSTNF